MTTFSSSPTSATTSHVSTPPQHIETSIRNARCSIPSPSHPHHLQSNHPPLLEQDPAIPPWRSSHLPWPLQMAWFSILTSRKIMAEITVHQRLLATAQFHASFANYLGVPPHTLHISHVHLCNDPQLVSQQPHETTLYMPPHGTCMKQLSNCTIFPQNFKTIVPHHLEAYHALPPKMFSAPSLCSHFWPLHSPQ